MEDSIFTKIIMGEIPCHKIYEDDQTFAFMDIHPIQPGHVLVITKKQIDEFTKLSDEELAALMATIKKVALRLKEVFPEKRRIGVMIEGLDIPHVHVKVFPINTGEEYRADANPDEPDHIELAEMAKKLAL